LQDWNEGDESALERLMPLVYDYLHRLAHQHMWREKPGQIFLQFKISLRMTSVLFSSGTNGETYREKFSQFVTGKCLGGRV